MRDFLDNPFRGGLPPEGSLHIPELEERFSQLRNLERQRREAQARAAHWRSAVRVLNDDGLAAAEQFLGERVGSAHELERLARNAESEIAELEQDYISLAIATREHVKENKDYYLAEAQRVYDESGAENFIRAAAEALLESLKKQDHLRAISQFIESCSTNADNVVFRPRTLVMDGESVEAVVERILDVALSRSETVMVRANGAPIRVRRIEDWEELPANVPESAVYENSQGYWDAQLRRVADKSAAGLIVEGAPGSH